ncbi:small-conductance mechanosensitive channel [Bacillus mesophilus]|uniref:Mechanosensitive ion channel n=1 Tax=Bacillus mesophilus TaxID=1808955 RepID=A0A6M0QDA8_9BACI|nr:mechanosensitive ion channel domain-containing protein [Bacillus mesophilus]MBM7662962.1 small-conductance mechanosensitive channel [Bacillus mesophilus]NEY73550.1 mechanosensitive ion channel [Bacillus mesophilus]
MLNQSIQELLSNLMITKLLFVLVGVTAIVIMIKLIQSNVSRYVKDHDNRYKTRKMINMIGYVIGLILIAVIYSDQLGGLTVVLGVTSAGIAFALQEVIISVAGWLSILVGNTFKTGDRVEMGGIKGDVIDLGVLRTTIMEVNEWVEGDLYNGRIVRVANSFVFKEPVYNYSSDFPFLWDEIKIPIKYGSNYKATKNIILQAGMDVTGDYSIKAREHWDEMVQKYLIEDSSTQPMVTLVANDNWVEYTLRYVTEYRKRRTTKDSLYTTILEEVDASGENIQFASATFDIVQVPSLDVNLKQNK